MANRYFDISKVKDPSPSKDPSRHFKSKYLLAHFENVNKLEGQLKRLPTAEEFFFLQTNNSFNAFTFVSFVCKNLKVKKLYASTYSISRKTISALMELHLFGMVDEITLLISDSMIKRNPMTIDMLLGVVAGHKNIHVLFGWNHSKVCLLETSPGPSEGGESNYYVIEGSGNWSDNAAVEQYTFANSKGLFEFRKELFDKDRARHIAEAGGLIKL